jgi:hypothetical protein
VGAVRFLRVWALYQPFRSARDQGRSYNVMRLGIVFSWLLVPLAVIGAVALRRRGTPLLVLLAPIALVSVAAVITFGGVRYQVAADLALAVLAAVGALTVGGLRRPAALGPSRRPPRGERS